MGIKADQNQSGKIYQTPDQIKRNCNRNSTQSTQTNNDLHHNHADTEQLILEFGWGNTLMNWALLRSLRALDFGRWSLFQFRWYTTAQRIGRQLGSR